MQPVLGGYLNDTRRFILLFCQLLALARQLMTGSTQRIH